MGILFTVTEMRYPFASKLIAEIAPEMGITVELEPEYEFAGELLFPDGRRHLFRNTNFNINPAGSTEIARDKGYTSYFLRKHGFRVPESRTFYSEALNRNLKPGRRRGVEEAVTYAQELGFPVYIKPNNMSQGRLVAKAYEPADIRKMAAAIFERVPVLIVEAACPGRDYRIVVLGDAIISAYERIPLSIVGDGRRSIEQLLDTAKDELAGLGRPNSEIDLLDPRIDDTLKRTGLTRKSVLEPGRKAALLEIANLSTGGSSIDVSEVIHPSSAELAVRATSALGLRLAGVDLLCEDISREISTQTWHIIELNPAPGLDNYSSLGVQAAERVRSLYRRILRYLAEDRSLG